MADVHQILSGFSYGEIDPKLQARTDFAGYLRGVKTANNVLSIPQGGFTDRFGTKYVATATATNKDYIRQYAFLFDNAVYNLVFEATTIKVFLENTLNATVTTTGYPAEVMRQLYFVPVQDRIIVLHENYTPNELKRTASAADAITGTDLAENYITLTTALTVDVVYPATFDTIAGLTSDPQILANTLYYVREIVANNIRVYSTPEDAAADTNAYDITVNGTGNINVYDTWTLSAIPFSNLPAYDFDAFATYSTSTFTFTAGATSGSFGTPATITASGAVFTTAHVGGIFIGNGGIGRIKTFTDTTHVDVITYEDFSSTAAFSGREAFLGEPAWSAARGYPSCGAFFQERLFLGGSRQVPNGVWGSTTFQAYDFDDSQALDDNAISFYPSASGLSYIRAMTSSKSLIVHSNAGNFSTPLTSELPVTPSTFSLTEQNRDGVSRVVPVFIDNQIIYVDKSSRNVKSMAWDIIQSSYMNTNISLPSSHLIQQPFDMEVFSEPAYTDGFFLLCANDDGTLGIYNSLIEQDIRGWTKAFTTQSSSDGYFRDITAALNRAWAIVERVIDGSTVLYIEELDFTVNVDCAKKYTDVLSETLTGLDHLEGETVQIFADGLVWPEQVVTSNQVVLSEPVVDAYVGLKFTSTIEPLPVNIDSQNGPTLYQDQHIRQTYIHYFESLGMTIQGYDIPTQELQDVVLDATPVPATGVYEYTTMEGWNSFDYTISIVQDQPLPMTLLAIGYDVEI
jgi:hypothetical protein